MLEIKNLTIEYKRPSSKVMVVDALNLVLLPGSFTMLAGRNGSGKSSLLRVMAGLQLQSSGQVCIQQLSLQDLIEPEIAGLVSIMFSTPPILEYTTVGEVVLTAMQRHFSLFKVDFGVEWERVNHCLQLCGMQDYMQRDFQSLSDGEKQKVMLARSLAQDTPVLLLDEPLAFLDYPSRIELLMLIQELAKTQQKIVLFSSHDLDISLAHCQNLLLLKGAGKWNWYQSETEIRSMDPMKLFELA